jgi:FMN phosphatase YigB (HAD superfamily)
MLPTTLTRRPSALLLDAGDTLLFIDTQALADALALHGETVEPARLQDTMFAAKRAYQASVAKHHNHEDGWSILMREVLVGSGVALTRASALLGPLRAIHDEFYFWRNVPSELPAALERARAAGIRLGVISNSEGKIESMLARVGLREPFEFVIDSHIEGVSKPNPEIFRRALVRLGVEGAEAIYAGDIPEVDVHGANGAGLHGVLVDAFDHYVTRTDVARVRSVAQLVDELVALPV